MSLYDIEVTAIDGTTHRMDAYRGKTLLIVNVASRCGYTPQYKGLEALYREFRDGGLVVLGFPCDQFGRQEPGTDEEIWKFCTESFDVTFPMFSKVEVKGKRAHPLFQWLGREQPGVFGIPAIKWNFTKFLVGGDGRVLKRYAMVSTPDVIGRDVRRLLDGDDAPPDSPR